jgi:hypothetical protein
MKSKEGMEVVKLLAEKYNLTSKQVLEIVESPFKFQVHLMANISDKEKYKFPSLKIINFGRFVQSECNVALFKKRLAYFNMLKERRKLNGLDNIEQGEQTGG